MYDKRSNQACGCGKRVHCWQVAHDSKRRRHSMYNADVAVYLAAFEWQAEWIMFCHLLNIEYNYRHDNSMKLSFFTTVQNKNKKYHILGTAVVRVWKDTIPRIWWTFRVPIWLGGYGIKIRKKRDLLKFISPGPSKIFRCEDCTQDGYS